MSPGYAITGGRARRREARHDCIDTMRESVKALEQLSVGEKWVVFLGILTLLLGLGNLGRAVIVLSYASNLPNVPLTISLTYLAAMGGFWGIVFIVCTIGLSRLRRWARWSTLAAVTLYLAHTWANRFLFYVSDYARQTVSRDLVLSLMVLLLFWISLNIPAVRKAFSEEE